MISSIKYPDVVVQLSGTDGNAFAVIGKVDRALRRAGVDPQPFIAEATKGTYDHVIQTVMSWVTVE